MADPRHFLDLDGIETDELRRILALGTAYKNGQANARPLTGKVLAMVFEKPSTRTRVSFEVGMRQLGGDVIVLEQHETQLGQGETIADTARVLSRYVDAIMLRTTDHTKLLELAQHASVPVINGLTDRTHPCQLMADVMTFEERKGAIAGKAVAWSGDVNNVSRTWAQAAMRFGFDLRIACPEGIDFPEGERDWSGCQGSTVTLGHDPRAAVAGADCVATDVWVSMGATHDAGWAERFAPYRVDEALMALAAPGAIFMHCLPAHRGQEVTDAVIDGPQSAVWDEAENRLHAQKGVLTWCLTG